MMFRRNTQGQIHCLDGPAIEYPRSILRGKEWWIEGRFYCSTYQSSYDFILGISRWCEDVSRLTTKGEKVNE